VLVAHSQASAADAAVISALRDGDEVAFTRLVDQHHAALRRIAQLYVSSSAAEGVVQETWLAVVRGVWAFQGRSSLRTWILRILINRAKTRAQRESRTVPIADAGIAETAGAVSSGSSGAAFSPDLEGGHDLSSGRGSRLLDPRPSPEAAVLAREARTHLRAAIDALPANQRTVITMRDLEGYSSEDVCNVLGLTETNQRVILHRARSAVRARVAAYFREE
jgi:RNA polymerase sigma-70 factor (ECF subfamily)